MHVLLVSFKAAGQHRQIRSKNAEFLFLTLSWQEGRRALMAKFRPAFYSFGKISRDLSKRANSLSHNYQNNKKARS